MLATIISLAFLFGILLIAFGYTQTKKATGIDPGGKRSMTTGAVLLALSILIAALWNPF